MSQFKHEQTVDVNGHSLSLCEFHANLYAWEKENSRAFPWRNTHNSFHILIAELMLRRTQARQVIPVYNQFVAQYPDAQTLMKAPSDEIARLLFPLGLAWRVPAFQQVAQMLVAVYGGKVPEDCSMLLTLPGVGDYVASAVSCFAFGQAVPIVDTNTVRIAGRLFGVTTHAESRRRRPIRQLLHRLVDTHEPKSYNYALLDLAALICVPAHPKCDVCPLLQHCATGHYNK